MSALPEHAADQGITTHGVIALVRELRTLIPNRIAEAFPEDREDQTPAQREAAANVRRLSLASWFRHLGQGRADRRVTQDWYLLLAVEELGPRFAKLYPSDELLPMIHEAALEVQRRDRAATAGQEAERRYQAQLAKEAQLRALPSRPWVDGEEIEPGIPRARLIADFESFQALLDTHQDPKQPVPVHRWVRERVRGERLGEARPASVPVPGGAGPGGSLGPRTRLADNGADAWPRPCPVCSHVCPESWYDYALHQAEHWPEHVALEQISNGWPQGSRVLFDRIASGR